MDEEEINGVKSPIKRLGSTRKLLIFNNIRLQLNEQLKCLDGRMEAQVALINELQDFFRKRAEAEMEYSKHLDKIIKSSQIKNKENKQKREQWPLFSSYACYQQLIDETKSVSKDHAALYYIHNVHLVGRLHQVMEDQQRFYKRCREIGYETHEEILRVLHELHTTMKTYHTYQTESRQAETKLRVAERQRYKLEMANPDSHEKLARSKKYKLIGKEINKRKNKYQEAKLKALKAKNEYILCLEASNTTIHKYFVDDLSDLIDCMDFGFHNCLSRALMMHYNAEQSKQRSLKAHMEQLTTIVNALDSRADKQRFLESCYSTFVMPKKFEFQGEHETPEPELQKVLRLDMEQRLQILEERLTCLKLENKETWKTIETAEASLSEMQKNNDFDYLKYFSLESPVLSRPETLEYKLRADRQETEEFYLMKFREYLLTTSKIARLEAKHEYIRKNLLNGSNSSPIPTSTKQKQACRKRIGRLHLSANTKLFGGSLEEYLENTKEEIPLIMRSCIRIINLYGMQHQGIFRVSGSQVEINNFKECFERGEDPLADISDSSDINSVAGLLKLYLRELREPLFPIMYYEKLIEISKMHSKKEIINELKELIRILPKNIIIVLRYLFAFLCHLTEYSDENMMDPNNLSICFGPTLVNIPEKYDQVIHQNYINDVIKNLIMYQDEIFPDDLGGMTYEKYFSQLDDVEESPNELTQEEPDTQDNFYSEEEAEISLEESHRDCNAQLEEQLSCKVDDSLTLFKENSEDWCRIGQNDYRVSKYRSKERNWDETETLHTPPDHLFEKTDSDNANEDILAEHVPLISLQPSTSREMRPEGMPFAQGICLSPTDCLSAFETNIEIMSRGSTLLENEKYSKYYRNNIDGVLQVEPEYSVEYIDDGGNASLDQQLQQQQRGNNNQEITNEGQNERNSLSMIMPSLEGMTTKRGTARKQQHCKSQSIGESVMVQQHQQLQLSHANSLSNTATTTTTVIPDDESQQEQQTTTNFSVNRELWQRRVTSQMQLMPPTSKPSSYSRASQEFRDMRQKHTPDLVMDLPLLAQDPADRKSTSSGSLSSSDEEMVMPSSLSQQQQTLPSRAEAATSPTGGPESPDMSTAAERFAKQNQCTLKKNTKITNLENASDNSKLKRIETTEHEKGTIIDAENENQMIVDGSNRGSDLIRAGRSDDFIVLPPRSTPKIVAKFADMHLTGGSQMVSPFKPQIKVKPTILRKPVLPFPHPHMSPELARKIEKQTQNTEQSN